MSHFDSSFCLDKVKKKLMDKPQIIAHVHHPVPYTIYDCKWVPRSAKLITMGSHPRGTGALELHEISKGALKLILKVCMEIWVLCSLPGSADSICLLIDINFLMN